MKFFAACLYLVFCSAPVLEGAYISRQEPAMGTFVTITIEQAEDSQSVLDDAFAKIRALEKRFSVFERESEISRLNRIKKLKVSEETLELIKKSIHVSSITGGAFDITCKPLSDLYRHAEERNVPPSDIELLEALERTGWQRIKISGSCVEIPGKMEIDPGGIAKGYIVDKTVQFLKDSGVENGMVNAGGDIYAFGRNPKGKKWQIGINDPFKKGAIRRIIEMSGFAVATSGDYERYFYIKNKKYGHIINPVTGKSVQDFPVSVTVSASDCAAADGLATAFFVLGAEKSVRLADKMEGVGAFIIDGDKRVYMSRDFLKGNF